MKNKKCIHMKFVILFDSKILFICEMLLIEIEGWIIFLNDLMTWKKLNAVDDEVLKRRIKPKKVGSNDLDSEKSTINPVVTCLQDHGIFKHGGRITTAAQLGSPAPPLQAFAAALRRLWRPRGAGQWRGRRQGGFSSGFRWIRHLSWVRREVQAQESCSSDLSLWRGCWGFACDSHEAVF